MTFSDLFNVMNIQRKMTWNSLSADLRDPTCSDESFRRSLKTFLFAKY